MYQISQMFIANYGFRDAFFPNRIIDFRKGKDVASSVMLFAENGRGKTSYLSMMMHMFVPERKRFVQYLQKKQSHRMEHYFSEGKPCLFMIEFVRQRRDLVPVKEPALVIGVYVRKVGDRVDETFFRFTPSGIRFDDLTPVKLTKEGKRLDWSHADAQQWIKEMKTLTEQRPLVDFRTFDTLGPWKNRLAEDGFRMTDFETMLTMATREGGLDAFMQCKSADEMLRKLHELFIDEMEHADHITKIQTILDDSRDLPVKQNQHRALIELREKEEGYILAAHGLTDLEKAAKIVQGQLLYLRNRVGDEIASVKMKTDEVTRQRPGLANDIVKMESDVSMARKRAEAARTTIVSKNILQSNRRRSELEASILDASCLKQTHDRALGLAQEKAGLENTVAQLKLEISESEKLTSERLQPVRRAGQKARQLAARLLEDIDRRIQKFDEKNALLAADTVKANEQKVQASVEHSLRKREYERFQVCLNEIAQLEEEARSVLDGRPISDLAAVVERLKSELVAEKTEHDQLANALRDNTHAERTATDNQQRAINSRAKVEQSLARFKEIIRRFDEKADVIQNSMLSSLTTEDDVDLSDGALISQANEKVGIFSEQASALHREIAAIEDKLVALRTVGGFEDEDVRRALQKCRDLNIKNARPFVLWLAEQNLEADEARRIVENNLSIALGLLVDTEQDRAKIVHAFGRMEWQLQKPVTVTVLDHALNEQLRGNAPEKGTVVLSAQTDYGYNTKSKEAAIQAYEAAIAAKNHIRQSILEQASALRELANELTSLQQILGNRTRHNLDDDIADKVQEVETLNIEIARLQESIDSCENTRTEMAARLAELETISTEKSEQLTPFAAMLTKLDTLRFRMEGVEDLPQLENKIAEASFTIARAEEAIANLAREIEAMSKSRDTAIEERTIKQGILNDIVHFDDVRVDIGDEDDFDTAFKSYRRLKDEYERNVDQVDAIAARRELLDQAQNDLAQKNKSINESIRAIALDLKTDEECLYACLSSWMTLSESDRAARLDELRTTLETGQSELKQLEKRLYDLFREESSSPEFDSYEIRQLKSTMDTHSIEQLEEMFANYQRESATLAITLAEYKERLKTIDEQLTALNNAGKDLDNISGRLDTKRFQNVDAVEIPGLDFSDLSELLKFTTQLKKQEEIASSEFSEKEQNAKQKNAKVCEFVAKNEAHIGLAGIVEQYHRFSQNYRARDSIGGDLLHHVDQILDSLETDIDSMTRKESDLIKLIARLYEFARENILQAVKICIPKNANSQFAGANILRLGEKLTVKAIKDVNPETVAERLIADLRVGSDTPKVEKMASLSVDMLNIVSQMLCQRPFELQILKPVVGSRIQYDVLHKMTGSGGQTITAALLLYLVATNIAGAAMDEELMGFLILDNPIGAANNTQLVMTQLESAKDFGIQMISTTGIMDDYLSAYERVIQFTASQVRNGLTEVEVEIHDEGENEISFLDFELHSAETSEVMVAADD